MTTPISAETIPPDSGVAPKRRVTLLLTLTVQSNTAAIASTVRELVAAGTPGTRLPSVRELMRRHRASPATVNAVMARLAHEGLVESRPGSGTFIAASATPTRGDYSWQSLTLGSRPQPGDALTALVAPPAPGVITLGYGYPDTSLQPLDLLARALGRAAKQPEAWARSPSRGVPELRAWFAAEAGNGSTADDVLVVPGGQAGLAVAMRSLTAPGDAVVVESPTYLGLIEVARSAGVRLVPVPTDADGVQPDLLADALSSSGAKLAVLQPLFANPTGVSLAPSRRSEVLGAVAACRAFLLEDDYARDLAYPGTAAPPPLLADDQDGHVIYLRTLSKSTAPSMRVAGIVARGPALRRLRHGRLVDDLFVSGVLQAAAFDVVTAPAWRRYLTSLRRALASRMAAAVAAVDALPVTVPVVPRGGFTLWLRLPDRVDDVEFTEAAAKVGVAILPGRPWFPAEAPGSFVRLAVAAADEHAITTAVERVGVLLVARS